MLMLAKDREGMTAEKFTASQAREKAINALAWKDAKRHMRKILSPFYDPAKRPMPRGVLEILVNPLAPVPIPGGLGRAALIAA